MPKRRTGLPSLSYMGVEAPTPPNLVRIDRSPTVNDYKEFDIGALWLRKNTEEIWMLVDKKSFVATWIRLGAGGAGAITQVDGGLNITTVNPTGPTVTVNLDAVISGITSMTVNNGGSLQSSTTNTNTLLVQAYDTGGAVYKPFITLTSGNPPTCDLASSVTIGGNYIYRVGGTDIAITDGGTGASSFTDHGILLGNGTAAITATAEPSDGQLLIGELGAAPSLSTLTPGAAIVITNAAHSITIDNTLSINTQVDDYTLVLGDAGKLIIMNKGTANTLTVPKNSAVAFPIGTQVLIFQLGAGATVVAPVDGDVTLYNPVDTTLQLYGQQSTIAIIKTDTDSWLVGGDLEQV